MKNDIKKAENPGASVRNLIVYSCFLLVGLWLSNVFYSVIRNVLVAQSRCEMVFAILLLVATVFVFAFVIAYAWSLFSGLPRIDFVCQEEHCLAELVNKIREDYLSHMPSADKYAQAVNISADSELAVKLQSLKCQIYAEDESFLADFKAFQGLQDEKAGEIIRKYAVIIAVKTAVSPWRIIDMAAVFYNSTLMACEIAKVYNRRTSRVSALRLVIGWMINLYISGGIGEVAEGASDAVGRSVGDLIGPDGMLGAVMPLAAKFAGKAAEGGLNAYLAYRLGKCSAEAFRYLQNSPQQGLRAVLAIQTVEYLSDRFPLNRSDALADVLNAFQTGKPLKGDTANYLLEAELSVKKITAEKLQYLLQLFVRISREKVVRVTIDVPYDDVWENAPKAFRERFIRERVDVLKVGIYPSAKKEEGL